MATDLYRRNPLPNLSRLRAIVLAALLFAVTLASLTPTHVYGDPACPGSWPPEARDGTAVDHGHGVIEYEGFHSDSHGARWFVIRSRDSNGYTTVRAYRATDDGEGNVSASTDETCHLLVRRPGDGEDTAEPRQSDFHKEFEPPTGVDGDRYALTALYLTTGGDRWFRNDNGLTDAPMSQWYGVTTDPEGRVTELKLVGNGLSGGITPRLDRLKPT